MRLNWVEVETMREGRKVIINLDSVRTIAPFTSAFSDVTPKQGCKLEFFNSAEMELRTTYEDLKKLTGARGL